MLVAFIQELSYGKHVTCKAVKAAKAEHTLIYSTRVLVRCARYQQVTRIAQTGCRSSDQRPDEE